MKSIFKADISNRARSVQEAAYHILPLLHLRRVFHGVQFGNTNLPEVRPQMLQTEETSSFLRDDSTDIFKRNNIDSYLARTSVSFCDGKYSILDSFCFAEFTAYHSLVYKVKETNNYVYDYQLDLLLKSLMEGNHENLNYQSINESINQSRQICFPV